MHTIKLRSIKFNSRLLRGHYRSLSGRHLPVSDGWLTVPDDGVAHYVKIEGERVRCTSAGTYYLRSAYYNQSNSRVFFLDTSRDSDGQGYGVNINTHYQILVAD